MEDIKKFQFPSNGKVDIQSFLLIFAVLVAIAFVSIPFKRESISKVRFLTGILKSEVGVSIPFKRESGYPKEQLDGLRSTRPEVSIPFKRESGYPKSIRYEEIASATFEFGFNSLQTGKWISKASGYSAFYKT